MLERKGFAEAAAGIAHTERVALEPVVSCSSGCMHLTAERDKVVEHLDPELVDDLGDSHLASTYCYCCTREVAEEHIGSQVW